MYLGYKYALNHVMVRSWTSYQWLWRQMSYNILVSVDILCIQASIHLNFVKVMQYSMACFCLFRFLIYLVRIEPQSVMGDSHQF